MRVSIRRLTQATFAAFALSASSHAASAMTAQKPPTCTAATTPAALAEPVYAERPGLSSEYGMMGTTVVKVDVTESGVASGASVLQTSGYPTLDMAALRTIRSARYTPETVNCSNVAGSYRAEVVFQP